MSVVGVLAHPPEDGFDLGRRALLEQGGTIARWSLTIVAVASGAPSSFATAG